MSERRAPRPVVAVVGATAVGKSDRVDAGAMLDLRRKTHLNRDELPLPQGCTQYDCNSDSVFDA